MDLTPANGPECPICGCKDSEIITPPKPILSGQHRWYPTGIAMCKNCWNDFHFADMGEPEQEPELQPELSPDLMPTPDLMPNTDPPILPPISTPPPLTTPEPQIDSTRAIVCPDCGSADVRVTSTQKLVRYYRCKVCPRRFKMPRRPIERVQRA